MSAIEENLNKRSRSGCLMCLGCGAHRTLSYEDLPIADLNPSPAQVGVPLLMRHQQHGVSAAVEGEQQLHDLVCRLFVEIPGRLVGKKNHRVVDQGAGTIKH